MARRTNDTATANYRVLFSGALGYYRGQVMPASALDAAGGPDKYLAMGAIEETSDPATEDVFALAPVNPAVDTAATSPALALTDGDGISPAGMPNVAPVNPGDTQGPGGQTEGGADADKTEGGADADKTEGGADADKTDGGAGADKTDGGGKTE